MAAIHHNIPYRSDDSPAVHQNDGAAKGNRKTGRGRATFPYEGLLKMTHRPHCIVDWEVVVFTISPESVKSLVESVVLSITFPVPSFRNSPLVPGMYVISPPIDKSFVPKLILPAVEVIKPVVNAALEIDAVVLILPVVRRLLL